MKWYKITLTNKQDPADHMEIFQSLALTAIKSGLIKREEVGIYSDFYHGPELSRGDTSVFYFNPTTFEALKEKLKQHKAEPCEPPDTSHLSRLV